MDTSSNTVSDLYVLGAVGQAARDSAATQCMDTTAILQGQAGTNLANMASTERLGIAVDDSIYKASMENRNAIERNADFNRDSTEKHGAAIALAVERTGAAGVAATNRSASEVLATVERTTGGIQTAQALNSIELRDLMNTHNISNLNNAKEILLNDNSNAGKITLQASQYFGQTELDISSIKSKLELQAAQNTASVQLEAVKNKNSISAQLAECCCELKQIVLGSSQTTQKVLQEIENNRIRDSLAAATTENLISKLTQH